MPAHDGRLTELDVLADCTDDATIRGYLRDPALADRLTLAIDERALGLMAGA